MNGIVNINKPTGITSFKTVSIVRKIFGVKKAGHTGTLDPLASGVLPICLEKATRICQFLTTSNKVYCGRMKLGSRTDTQDAEGKPVEVCESFTVTEEQIRSVFSKYVGEIEQLPPMFSAKKVDGKKLYQLARKGIEVERDRKTVHIYSLDFLGMEGDEVLFRAETSPGTYIRTLCDAIGEDLGCWAHLKSLVRERVGNMDIRDAVTLEQLKELKKENRLPEVLRGLMEALSFYPLVQVNLRTQTDLFRGLMITKRGITRIETPFKAKDILRTAGPGGNLIAMVETLVDSNDYGKLADDIPVMKSKKVFPD